MSERSTRLDWESMRSVPEWIGKTDDTPVPNRVRIRVCDREGWKCQGCGRSMWDGTRLNTDHVQAIINGGENRESNLQTLCDRCHKEKTKGDVKIKAKTHRIRVKHLGLKKPKGRALPGTKRSGIRKRMSGKVERW